MQTELQKKRSTYMKKWNAKNRDRINKERREKLKLLKKNDPVEYERRLELHRKASKKYQDKNKDKINAKQKSKNWYYDEETRKEIRARYYDNHPIRNILISIQHRAKKKGLKFNLTEKWYQEEIKKGCAMTNINFDTHKSGTPWIPHIDRIVPEKGYTQKNCRLVCACYNLAKFTWKDEDVLKMAEGLIKFRIKNGM